MNAEFWRGRRTLVTGATGLQGGWLIPELLRRQASVVVLARRPTAGSIFVDKGWIDRVEVVWGSVCDASLVGNIVQEGGIETVFHLAAQSQAALGRQDPVGTLEVNVRGTWNLLEAARQSPRCQVIVASSDKTYAESARPPYREGDPLGGEYPYDVSKTCMDLISTAYATTYGLSVGIVRFGNVFGGGDSNLGRIIPGVILATLKGEPFVIRGDGKSLRDFVYVEDAIEAYFLVAEKLAEEPSLRGAAFNLSQDTPRTTLEIARMVLRLMGRMDLEPIVLGRESTERREQYASAEKARILLGWRPCIGTEEGLRRTIDWYAVHFGEQAVLRATLG
jgi:CDP-glucose 4,6-dehydratase